MEAFCEILSIYFADIHVAPEVSTKNRNTEISNNVADVAAKIVKQLEYYFGDRNLRQDRFMLREVTLDNGWISLDTMLNFKR